MPKLEISQPTVDISSRRLPGTDAGAFGIDISRALTGVGEAIGEFGSVLAEKDRRDQLNYAERDYSQSMVEWQKTEAALLLEHAGNPEGHTERILASWTEFTEGMIRDAPSQIQSEYLTSRYNDVLPQVSGRAVGHEAVQNANLRVSNMLDANDADANRAFIDPTLMQQLIDERLTFIETQSFDPTVAANLRRDAEESISAASIRGLIAVDPQAALDLLKSGDLNDLLAPTAAQTLTEQAEVALHNGNRQQSIDQAMDFTNLLLAVNRGEKGQADIDAFRQRALMTDASTPSQIFRLQSAFDKPNAEQERLNRQRQGLEMVNSAYLGELVLDPNDSETREWVNDHYNMWLQQPEIQALDPDRRRGIIADYANRIGVVPSGFISGTRRAFISNNPEMVADGADNFAVMMGVNPTFATQFDADTRSYAEHYNTLVDAGYSDAEALERVTVDRSFTPQQRDQRNDAFARIVREVGDDDKFREKVAERIEDTWFKGEESFDGDNIPPTLMAEFEDTWRTEYLLSNNQDPAFNMALRVMQGRWGVSYMTGKAVLTRDAPELHYGIPDLDAEDNAEWMLEQLLSDLGPPLSGVEFKDRFELTRHPTISGPNGSPAYSVIVLSDDGIRNIQQDAWIPNYVTSPAGIRANQTLEEAVESARALREAGLGSAFPSDVTAFEGRGRLK